MKPVALRFSVSCGCTKVIRLSDIAFITCPTPDTATLADNNLSTRVLLRHTLAADHGLAWGVMMKHIEENPTEWMEFERPNPTSENDGQVEGFVAHGWVRKAYLYSYKTNCEQVETTIELRTPMSCGDIQLVVQSSKKNQAIIDYIDSLVEYNDYCTTNEEDKIIEAANRMIDNDETPSILN